MSTFNYARPEASALRMFKKYGTPCTITHQNIGTYDPATGTHSENTETVQTGIGVVFEWGLNGATPRYGIGTGSDLIKAGDKQLMLASSGITKPELNDTVFLQGQAYSIFMIKELSPGDTILYYECNIRGF